LCPITIAEPNKNSPKESHLCPGLQNSDSDLPDALTVASAAGFWKAFLLADIASFIFVTPREAVEKSPHHRLERARL
jgi:hypothetical protein